MPGGQFESYRTFELAYGNADRERKGLARRRMYRTIAPWVTENPITHHLLSNQPEKVIAAIDQAAEVGFEAIILSFGSGFNMENRQPDFLARWKEVADYAEKKGVELGAYSLFSVAQCRTGTHDRFPGGPEANPWSVPGSNLRMGATMVADRWQLFR
jgi:sugar phosphate isomerase/epimerase